MTETKGMLNKLMSQLAAQGATLHSLSSQLPPSQESPVDVNPADSSTAQDGSAPLAIVGCDNDAIIKKSNRPATSGKEIDPLENHNSVGSNRTPESQVNATQRPEALSQETVSPTIELPQQIKCRLWILKRSNIVAVGTVYKSDKKQKLHNKPLPKDCYKVSIDQSIVDAACIPESRNNPFKTIKDSVGSFVAWPKDQVLFDEKVTPPNSLQKVDENKTAPKVQSKRKTMYISGNRAKASEAQHEESKVFKLVIANCLDHEQFVSV